MTQFQALDPRVEVNGETVLSVVAGMGVFRSAALQLLAENGIEFPEPGQFCPRGSRVRRAHGRRLPPRGRGGLQLQGELVGVSSSGPTARQRRASSADSARPYAPIATAWLVPSRDKPTPIRLSRS